MKTKIGKLENEKQGNDFLPLRPHTLISLWDRLVRKREREEAISRRKREFIAFMESWRHEIGRSYLVVGGFEHKESSFKDMISTFILQAGLVKPDFTPAERKEFETLCATLIGWKHKTIYDPTNNEKAQKEMSDIIVFVEKTGL
jgi:hypothetical protein